MQGTGTFHGMSLLVFFKNILNIIRCHPAIGFIADKDYRCKAASSNHPFAPSPLSLYT